MEAAVAAGLLSLPAGVVAAVHRSGGEVLTGGRELPPLSGCHCWGGRVTRAADRSAGWCRACAAGAAAGAAAPHGRMGLPGRWRVLRRRRAAGRAAGGGAPDARASATAAAAGGAAAAVPPPAVAGVGAAGGGLLEREPPRAAQRRRRAGAGRRLPRQMGRWATHSLLIAFVYTANTTGADMAAFAKQANARALQTQSAPTPAARRVSRAVVPQRHARSRLLASAQGGDGAGPGPSSQRAIADSDLAFVGKMVVLSFAGEPGLAACSGQRSVNWDEEWGGRMGFDASTSTRLMPCTALASQHAAGLPPTNLRAPLRCRTGGATIKYGSLLLDLPFHPTAAVALGVVLGTPAAYSAYLLTRKND